MAFLPRTFGSDHALPARRTQTGLAALAVAILLAVGGPLSARAADPLRTVRLTNGVRAHLITAEYLESITIKDGTRGVIPLDADTYLSVVTDVGDPLIYNKGDGAFHPFCTEDVIDLLGEIRLPAGSLDVEVYILPYPRANQLSSSASGRRVFLSPQVGPMSREGAAYVISHELGHVFQARYMPDSDRRRWEEYRHLRGIDDRTVFCDNAQHADRPKEIFAEDFRVLFGGPLAYFGGQIENTRLSPPTFVAGLREFYEKLEQPTSARALIASVNTYPNPFNPSTEFHVQLTDRFVDSGKPLHVRIYDVRGAFVRDIYTAAPATNDVHVQWDGRDAHGTEVASAVYFGVVQAGNERMTQKLLMIK